MEQIEFLIQPGDAVGQTAQRLISKLCAEMTERYGQPPSPFSLAETLQEREVFLIASVGAEAVACGALRFYDPDTAEIKRMYVEPAWRGRGIAGRILNALENYARKFSYKSILLETGILQPEARTAYTKAGYVQIPSFGPYSGNPKSVCYRKSLLSPTFSKAL